MSADVLCLPAPPAGVSDYDDAFVARLAMGQPYHDVDRTTGLTGCGEPTGPPTGPAQYQHGFVTGVWRVMDAGCSPCPTCYPAQRRAA